MKFNPFKKLESTKYKLEEPQDMKIRVKNLSGITVLSLYEEQPKDGLWFDASIAKVDSKLPSNIKRRKEEDLFSNGDLIHAKGLGQAGDYKIIEIYDVHIKNELLDNILEKNNFNIEEEESIIQAIKYINDLITEQENEVQKYNKVKLAFNTREGISQMSSYINEEEEKFTKLFDIYQYLNIKLKLIEKEKHQS